MAAEKYVNARIPTSDTDSVVRLRDADSIPVEDDAFEALECLKSWQRDELIAASREVIKVIEDMLNTLCEEDLRHIVPSRPRLRTDGLDYGEH